MVEETGWLDVVEPLRTFGLEALLVALLEALLDLWASAMDIAFTKSHFFTCMRRVSDRDLSLTD